MGEETEEEEEEEKQFDDSTHGYLIYFDEHKDCNNLFLAAFMWFIQMFLYSLLWSEAMGLVKEDQVEVTIGYFACSDADGNIYDLGQWKKLLFDIGIRGHYRFKD